jgi:CopG family nickel-responsive transcriptional regulator
LVRFGVSAEEEPMVNFDRLSADKDYSNRSEALRDLMRDALVLAAWRNPLTPTCWAV